MAQGEIDALNKVYQDKIADQRVVNEGEKQENIINKHFDWFIRFY